MDIVVISASTALLGILVFFTSLTIGNYVGDIESQNFKAAMILCKIGIGITFIGVIGVGIGYLSS